MKADSTTSLLATLRSISPRDNPRILSIGLTRLVLAVQAKFGEGKIIKVGREHAPPLKTRLTSRHGGAGLLGSIGLDLSQLPRQASLGTALRYAELHEGGGIFRRRAHTRTRNGRTHRVRSHTATFGKRAFMRPALNATRPKMPDILINLLREESNR